MATAIAAADTHERSEREAHSDALTSLPNRRQLSDDLRGVLHEAAAGGQPQAIAMVDIDHFKRFNDGYGHKVGDITLQKVAEVLQSSMRDQDRAYRFGGEEFLLIFAGVDGENAMKLAERARAAVERTPLTGETMQPVGPVTGVGRRRALSRARYRHGGADRLSPTARCTRRRRWGATA